ncbi:MAG: hypothetical protein IKY10_04670 [Clostridia bacterium]|nr:hypothetical protein [Clostridia bacterium]
MITFEDYRKDKEFKIDSLTYQEIFESLKGGIETSICRHQKIKKIDELTYNDLDSNVDFVYGKDKDMYPRVHFMVRAYSKKLNEAMYYYIFLNAFEIKIYRAYQNNNDFVEYKELTQALIDMMNEKYPNSDYVEKREKYFKMAELIERKRQELLFF